MLECSAGNCFDDIKIEGFLPIVINAAKSCARAICGNGRDMPEPVIGKSRACLSVAIGERFKDDAFNGSIDGSMPCIRFKSGEEIPVFSKASVRASKLIFEVSRELLDAFAASASCAEANAFELPETVFIPKSGIAPDCEASAYARSMLNSLAHTAGAGQPNEASKFALMSCLMLFSLSGAALKNAHSAATRAVLRAVETGTLNEVDSAAMGAALKYAEDNSAKNE